MQVLKPHVSLNVTAIDAAVAFYEKLFGVPPVKRRAGYAKFDLVSPALNLTMQEAPRTGVNASHFGIQVEGPADVREAALRLEKLGLTTAREDDVTCCYSLQDKVWVQDPDGNAWEFFTVKADAATMHGTATPQQACCGPECCSPESSDVAASERGTE
jgi:catechol 2,3-dioxygenase-like lactoylglutathione lyase family enzyme